MAIMLAACRSDRSSTHLPRSGNDIVPPLCHLKSRRRPNHLNSSNRYPIYLILLSALLFFPGLGARDFWAPVEPRYAEIARVMFAKREWIVPMVNGELYTDKPILYFWLVLIAAKIAGAVNEWTVRLPVAMGGVGFVLATYFFARDFFSPRVGLLASVMLATSVRVIWEARWAHIDVLFCFFFLLSLYFAGRALMQKGNPNEILIAYLFMGLATLAKGLIGVALPALLLVSFMIARRDWSMLGAAKLHLGIPIFLIVVAPWPLLVNAATENRWLADFVYVHHIQRYTAGAGHRQPFFYYFTTLPVDLLPWTIFAIPALCAYRRVHGLMGDPVKLFVVLWFVVVFFFFSASDTKRELYLMPLLPAVAMFIAHYIDDLDTGRLPQDALYRWLLVFFFASIGMTGLGLPATAWVLRRDVFWISLPVAGVLVAAGAAAVLYIRNKKPLGVVAVTALMMVLTLLCAVLWIFPYIEVFKSRRPFSIEVKRIVPATATLYVYADTMNDFNFYTEREIIPVVATPQQLEGLLSHHPDSYLLVRERDLEKVHRVSKAKIIISRPVGSSNWYLIFLDGRRANMRVR
jgi:4-amino-4-deoxy-L-arabinose transferase-like glycosyltransferase